MKTIEGRVAVVTGAASGIGRGLAETFVAAGMKVVLADVEEAPLAATTKALRDAGGDVHAIRTDVSKPDEVEALARETLRKYGAVHVLCNNAGIGAIDVGGSWNRTLDDWRWILDVNLMGVIHGVHAFLPRMLEQGDEAHIVNTASLAGLVASGTLYGTTKFAVVGFSENLYLELVRGGHKPRVSVLCPGFVVTNILDPYRNKPAELANVTPRGTDPQTERLLALAREQMKRGLSPRVVGEQVLAAIREERLWVLTHPEHTPLIERRLNEILSGRNPTGLRLG
jgi:NAD(P)-dependent dehydrogenase (short-subunit alcohol dehydrogenase family)